MLDGEVKLKLKWDLTFDMSGGWKRAQPAGRRPLDGVVRRRAHWFVRLPMARSKRKRHERPFWISVTEYVGSGRPPSANQPPAMPIFSGSTDTNQKRVVPQTAQKWRSWSWFCEARGETS